LLTPFAQLLQSASIPTPKVRFYLISTAMACPLPAWVIRGEEDEVVVVVVVETLEFMLTRLMQLRSTPGLSSKFLALVLMSEEKDLLTILQPQQYGPPQGQYYQQGPPPYVFANAPASRYDPRS
jgi:hypothetical protein